MEQTPEEAVEGIKRAVEKPRLEEAPREIVLTRLKEFTSELEESVRLTTEVYKWLEPSGAEGRSWKKEVKYALEHRDKVYIPQMTYPILERGFLEEERREETTLNTHEVADRLEGLKEEVRQKYPEIREIAQAAIEKELGKVALLEAVKAGNTQEANRLVGEIYGTVPEALSSFAERVYKDRLKSTPRIPEQAKKIKANKLHSEDIREYFEHALFMVGAEDWRVVVTPQQRAIDVMGTEKTVFVPETRTVNGIKFLKLIAHEIGVHAATTQKAIESGLGPVPLGSEYELLQEGIAKVAEDDVETMLLSRTEQPLPYYVLGIAKATEANGDFWEVWDYLVDLRRKEYLARGKSQGYAEKNAVKMTIPLVRRIFRGNPNLPKGGYVFTKDKAYLEGELVAQKIKDAGYLGYLLAGKYDLPTLLFLIKTGVIPKEAVNLTIDVSQKIWESEGDRDFLENLSWYRENYNPPYWREFGLTDEEYLKRWMELGEKKG